jgi:hypothetical protein
VTPSWKLIYLLIAIHPYHYHALLLQSVHLCCYSIVILSQYIIELSPYSYVHCYSGSFIFNLLWFGSSNVLHSSVHSIASNCLSLPNVQYVHSHLHSSLAMTVHHRLANPTWIILLPAMTVCCYY